MSDALPSAGEEKKRILILADSHGRNISGILSYVLRRKSEVLVIFKPNATLGCVAEDIDKLTTSFTMSDVVVLIGGTNDLDRGSSEALVSTIEGLQRRLERRTQLIVATLPRRYDNRKYNRIIDELNGGIRALRSRYGYMKILELGDMGKDYHTNQGLHLNIKGKIKLCLKLCKEMDSLPRTSILSPPMRKVADFLKLFTLPDGHWFNYDSPHTSDLKSSDLNTTEVSQAPREKQHRVKLLVIDTSITVFTSVGEKHSIAKNMVPKPFEVILEPIVDGERRNDDNYEYSAVRRLRSKRAYSYWTENTFSVGFHCHTNVRMGPRKTVNLRATGSQGQITFTVTETGLKLAMNQNPVAIVLTLDVGSFLNVDENKNVNYVFEGSTVGTRFCKRMLVLKLKIKSNMRLLCSSVASCFVMSGTYGWVGGMNTSEKKTTDRGMATMQLNDQKVTDGECKRVVIPDGTFQDRVFNLFPDVVVFRPILIASGHEFFIYFHSPGHVEVAHYAEFFVINSASLVQYVRLRLCTYVILSRGPRHDCKTRTRELHFVDETFRPVLQLGQHTCHPSALDSERLDDDVILTDTLIRALVYLKCKNLTSSKVACQKQTRKARNDGGVPEITKQLTKVTTTYLSCCGDFNSAMIARRLKSEAASKERHSESTNSCSDRQV